METYELTQEDHTLDIAFRTNARLARRRPHPLSAQKAEQRAACLASHVAKYEPRSPCSPCSPASKASRDTSCSCSFGSAACSEDETTSDWNARLATQTSRDTFSSFSSGSVACSGDESTSDCLSPRSGKGDGVPCKERNDQGSIKNDQLRDAVGTEHGRPNLIGFWKRYRRARTRVSPDCDPSVMQSNGEGGLQEQVRPTSCHRRTLKSIMRFTRHETDDHTKRFHSLFPVDSPGAVHGNFDGIDYVASYVDDESVLPNEGGTSVGRSQSSLKCFIEKGTSRIRAVFEKARVSASPKA
eukprot:TRINITY_DN29673_c1_g1_i1.p1 TRINITY_DN29673_c1_g1~~TRINITY_DN29673_c1_g1_i1.p1  ORF type:complete len:336 (+),score=19.33 TRINITY_DN29673_c1_g1_i1:115-1008(+)